MSLSSKWLKWARDIAVIGAIFFAVQSWQSRNMLDTDGSVEIAPVNLVSINGDINALAEPGKRTLVYFFAPWCNVCAMSIGNLDYLEQEDLKIVRVALDYNDVESVQNFVSQNNVNGEVLLGTQAQKTAFQVPGYPAYYLLDEEMKVVSRAFGYSTAVGLKVKNYLNQG